jgi:hypothetical protein
MGDGSLNPSTTPGMLPAVSDTDPYILTWCGELRQEWYDGAYHVSGTPWRAFDQIPAYGEQRCLDIDENSICYYGSHPEYCPLEFINTEGDHPLRNVMVDLGEGNEKCFDKFTFAQAETLSEYQYNGNPFYIQGSNNPSAIVGDAVDSSNWDDLLSIEAIDENHTTSYGGQIPGIIWNHSGYGENFVLNPYTFINNIKYRYYRICGLQSISEFMFVEESVTTSASLLLLHMNGENESQDFIDSSNVPHEVVAHGSVVQDTTNTIVGSASARFETVADYLSISDPNNWDIFNRPFTIQFWFKPHDLIGDQIVFSQTQDPMNYLICTYNCVTKKLIFKIRQNGDNKILLVTEVDLELDVEAHIAIVGNWE